ncbi:MAG TPA: A/G-specific adenine glycosylase [Jatrophihabitans sp.]|nr:A/G-specific adenine glycosylase [Jatrophihabitans sp.]
MPSLVEPVLGWYARSARELPWRSADASPWAVLVSEVMLQQTPVARVLPAYRAWLTRWPTPAALAAEPAGEAVRMWGRLGYPRRALRLHQCAVIVRDSYDGELPADVELLEQLPGIGAYTARAIAAFAYRQRVPVVDTNVRRVIARALRGQGAAGPPAKTHDHRDAATLLPDEPDMAARFSVALMELGALICTPETPRCAECPIAGQCAWRLAGSPPYAGPTVRPQRFNGTDRQVRGLLMAVLRDSHAPVEKHALDVVWHDATQRERALDSLLVDGLVDLLSDGRFALPT